MATAAGIRRVTLVRVKNGEQLPRYETLVALAGALGRYARTWDASHRRGPPRAKAMG